MIQFDAPEDRDTYTHRVGRTGRAGQAGAGISFVLADQHPEMAKIAKELGLAGEYHEGTAQHVPAGRANSGGQNGSRSNGTGRGGGNGSGGNRNGGRRRNRSRQRSRG